MAERVMYRLFPAFVDRVAGRRLAIEVTVSTVSRVVVTFFDRKPLFDVWLDLSSEYVAYRS